MTCGQTRTVMYLADRMESVSPQWVEAQDHLKHCPECRAFFFDEEALRSVLKTRLAKQAVPAHVRERILARIGEARTYDGRRRAFSLRGTRVRAAVATALGVILLFLVGIVGYQSLNNDPQERVLAELIDDHLRFKLGASALESSQVKQVEAWFSGKVDYPVQAPRFEQTELVGGRLCYLFGKKGAMLFYRKDGAMLALYVLDGTDLNIDRVARPESGDRGFAYGVGKGHNLVLWQDRGLVYALVSHLQKDELVRLAANVSRGG